MQTAAPGPKVTTRVGRPAKVKVSANRRGAAVVFGQEHGRPKQLKKNAVTSAKVKNGTLKPDDLNAAALFKGMSVVTRTTSFTFPEDNGSTGQYLSDDVQCNAGEVVVGGGSELSNNVSSSSQPNVIVVHNRPATSTGAAPANGAAPTGWYVQARRNTDTFATTVTVYVLCASETP